MATLISVLAVYWLTLAITTKDGPRGILYKIRHIKALSALNCFACSSIYVSAIISLYTAHTFVAWLVITPALAGGALIIDKCLENY